MRGLQEKKIEEYNAQILSMIYEQQKETRKFYAENPSEIIDNRYIVYKRKNNKRYTSSDGYRSGWDQEILTYFDLKTGSILYQEEKKTEYGKTSYSHTLGGDGWRRGAVISGTTAGSWDTESYIVCDKKFKDRIYGDVYKKWGDIIFNNMQILGGGWHPKEEFITIIQEIEKRREEEKKLFKKYLGESFKDPDVDFEEYLNRARKALKEKGDKNSA